MLNLANSWRLSSTLHRIEMESSICGLRGSTCVCVDCVMILFGCGKIGTWGSVLQVCLRTFLSLQLEGLQFLSFERLLRVSEGWNARCCHSLKGVEEFYFKSTFISK